MFVGRSVVTINKLIINVKYLFSVERQLIAAFGWVDGSASERAGGRANGR